MTPERFAELTGLGTSDLLVRELLDELEAVRAREADWQKLGEQVRIAACGPGHSMGSRVEELTTILDRLSQANALVAKLRAKLKAIGKDMSGREPLAAALALGVLEEVGLE